MTARTQPCAGPTGSTVTTGNATGGDQFNVVTITGTGVTCTYITSPVVHNRATSLKMHHSSNITSTIYVGWSGLPDANNAYCYAYVYLTRYLSGYVRLLNLYGTGTQKSATAFITPSGTVEIDDKTDSAIATTTAKIPLNAWCRVELSVTGISAGLGTVTGSIYSGPNLETTTPDTGGRVSGSGKQVLPVNEFRVGALKGSDAADYDCYISDVAYSDVSMPALPVSTLGTPIGGGGFPTRVNRLPDPSFENGNSSVGVNNGTNYTSNGRDTTVARPGSNGTSTWKTVRSGVTGVSPTVTTIYPTAAGATTSSVNRLPVVPGETLSWSVWFRCSVDVKATLGVTFKDAANGTLSSVQDPASGVLPANTWTLVKQENLTVVASAVIGWPYISLTTASGANVVGGETAGVDDCIVVSGATVPAYFDGYSPGTQWAGLPWGSVSVQGLRSLAQLNKVFDPSAETGLSGSFTSNSPTLYPVTFDTAVKHSGTRSARSDRTTSNPSNILASCYMTGAGVTNPSVSTMSPGDVISFGMWVRCSVDQWRQAWGIQFRDATAAAIGAGDVENVFGSYPANTWTFVTREGVVVPAGVAFANIYLNVRGPSGYSTVGTEQTWQDDCVMVFGPKCPPYFDGYSPGCQWMAVPYQSLSVRPVGPWSQWDGQYEQPLSYAGTWDGAALQQQQLATVAVV